METWFDFSQTLNNDKVAFALLKILGIVKMVILEYTFTYWDNYLFSR